MSTDRVACQGQGCPSTILPATAARTGGLCMTCVNRRNRAEQQEYPADWPTSPWQSALLSLSPRMPMQALESDGGGGSASQIGGQPNWVQDAQYPKCPDCGQSMHFLAQLDNGDFPSHEGIHYAFLCADCRVTATHYQQS